VIAARLSQKQTNIVTPNRFEALETCTTVDTPAFVPWTVESVMQFRLDSIKSFANGFCELCLKEKGIKECNLEKCFWHQRMEKELEEARNQPVITSKKSWEEEGKATSSPKLPNAGSQRQKRDLSSESLDH
jgi:hypothetical protein